MKKAFVKMSKSSEREEFYVSLDHTIVIKNEDYEDKNYIPLKNLTNNYIFGLNNKSFQRLIKIINFLRKLHILQ